MKRKIIMVLLVAFVYVTMSARKSGCSKEETEKLLSPVQAIATLVKHEDGKVEADLTLISTAVNPSIFVDTAAEARLRVIDEQTSGVKSVPLALKSSGHYAADSAGNPDLYFKYGVLYSFDFKLDDDKAAGQVKGGTFVAQVNAPQNGVTVSVKKAPAAALLTCEIEIAGNYKKGILQVVDGSGKETYSNWNMATPDFDGSKWNSLIVGNTHTIPAAAFPDSGAYTVFFAACNLVQGFDPSLSSQLGALSGFLACEETSVGVNVP